MKQLNLNHLEAYRIADMLIHFYLGLKLHLANFPYLDFDSWSEPEFSYMEYIEEIPQQIGELD